MTFCCGLNIILLKIGYCAHIARDFSGYEVGTIVPMYIVRTYCAPNHGGQVQHKYYYEQYQVSKFYHVISIQTSL